MRLVGEPDWSTRDGLREIGRARAERIDGWRAPVAYAVGYRRDLVWTFPCVNHPGGALSAVVLAEVLGYSSGTIEFDMSAEQLAEAIDNLPPAEAAVGVEHPNLAAWRRIVAQPREAIAAVFIGSLDDPQAGPADETLRRVLAGS